MKTVEKIRRDNLATIIDEAGGMSALAKKIDRSYAQVNQWKNASIDSKTGKPRSLGSATARRIEELFNKQAGWMDIDHSNESNNIEAAPTELSPKQQALLGYFNGLTESQQEEVIRELQEKKQQNDNLLLELLERRAEKK